jgi:hypothetical protein
MGGPIFCAGDFSFFFPFRDGCSFWRYVRLVRGLFARTSVSFWTGIWDRKLTRAAVRLTSICGNVRLTGDGPNYFADLPLLELGVRSPSHQDVFLKR